jgi:hypothetical protein
MDQSYNIYGLAYCLSPNENESVRRVICNWIHSQKKMGLDPKSEELRHASNVMGLKQ